MRLQINDDCVLVVTDYLYTPPILPYLSGHPDNWYAGEPEHLECRDFELRIFGEVAIDQDSKPNASLLIKLHEEELYELARDAAIKD